ncbi:DUF1622 domain-containing protein [Agathobaculum sp.]|uniref:DUF1622 domain-containing protein n=1 Tax=Agathobaculum sp. TaxID=2048138 RepID=UPI002A812F01|nr:DUF1622 domain-containing protein [Agathobaculum sp.]MCI5704015.1 DUF1622 domain-containing protein [Pseudoflavonifractor sp.]MDY3618925.1 DUF1622 domain-containing protein [Agathobaculum sp.]
MGVADRFLSLIVEAAILLFEYIGVGVIIFAGVLGIVNYVRREPLTRLKLAKGMAMGLEFKLGSEILRTVVVREFSEILIVGAIILLRAALTFLIHWEIKNEEAATGEQLKEP